MERLVKAINKLEGTRNVIYNRDYPNHRIDKNTEESSKYLENPLANAGAKKKVI